MVSLTDINSRFASIQRGITHIQMDIDRMYTDLGALASHTVSLLLLTPLTLKNSWKTPKEVWNNTLNKLCQMLLTKIHGVTMDYSELTQ